MSATLDLGLIDKLDELIAKVELHLTRTVKVGDVQSYHRLRTIPGFGPILALVLLHEMHQAERFEHVGQFLSYARLAPCDHESAGKKLGSGGKKIGNAHLRWAFGEAACLFLRGCERARQWKQKQEKKHGGAKALAILAARLARAVYHMLRKEEAFDEERFWSGQGKPAAAPTATAKSTAQRPDQGRSGASDSEQARYSPRIAPAREGGDTLKTGREVTCSSSLFRGSPMPAIDYRRARAELRLARVLELIGYQPRRRAGQQWRGGCPRCLALPGGRIQPACGLCGGRGWLTRTEYDRCTHQERLQLERLRRG